MHKDYIELGKKYIDAIYRIEINKRNNITGLYALETHRLKCHKALCERLGLDHYKTKEVTGNLDKIIKFDIDKLNEDFDFWLEKYAERLVAELSKRIIRDDYKSDEKINDEEDNLFEEIELVSQKQQ